MKLNSFSYTEYGGDPREWRLAALSLGQVNLLVGKNATGKSRALNVIGCLAQLVSGRMQQAVDSGNFEAAFDNAGESVHYQLEIHESKVISEVLEVAGTQLLARGRGGLGKIFYAKQSESLDFQTPEHEVAVVARRDSLQHPFLEPLHEWGGSLLHFHFGSPLGKTNFVVFTEGAPPVDTRDTNQVVGIFRRGLKDFGDPFKAAIIEDMRRLDYSIEDIEVATPSVIRASFPGPLMGLAVKEESLQAMTDQLNMSQGMFRALSVLVQLSYSRFSGKHGCIMVDDIGEGLDFERSCALIKLLVERSVSSNVQLIMSTNDRFVMNNVPLEAWTVLHRAQDGVHVLNYENSKAAFDEFAFTGLNNFDFFATDFLGERQRADEEAGRVR